MEELVIVRANKTSFLDELREKIMEMNMIHYASEAALEMKFENLDELNYAIKQAMNIFSSIGISLEENFKGFYRCSEDGIKFDYKLSPLAYELVCLNGYSTNPNVAMMQITILQNNNFK